MDTVEIGGASFKLACLVPPAGYTASLPTLASAPGFRVWSDAEIMDFLKAKEPKRRRQQFGGAEWMRNQGQVGSCCPTATTGAYLRALALTGANSIPKLNSEFLYAQINRGSDNGALLADASRAVRDIGILEDNGSHRFNRDIYANNYTAAEKTSAAANRASAVYSAATPQELYTLLLSGQGAAVVAVHVGNGDVFMNLDRYGFPGATRGPGNHAVGAQDVELVNGRPAIDAFNSWGLEYGDAGCMYLDWDSHMAGTVNYHQYFCILSTQAAQFDGDAIQVSQ